ncbi:MAG: trypsin-like peptidase domain-containing protein, partial [Clostridia bacterium]|nr:trypsin-like peptidase domain-containing protein [Clostridia bacterium]
MCNNNQNEQIISDAEENTASAFDENNIGDTESKEDTVAEGFNVSEEGHTAEAPVFVDPYVQQTQKIEDFKPVNYSSVKKRKPVAAGIKIFALLMAAVILVTGSCLTGYLIGISRNTGLKNNFQDTNLNLTAKPADTDEFTAAQVYDMLNKSVVGITVYGSDGKASTASGVVYTENGYIITNDHIYDTIAGAKFIIRTYDGVEYPAVFVAGDSRSDLAVLKIEASGFVPAVFGNDKELVIGENVVAIGRPNNIEENSITEGIISLKDRRVSTTTSYSMKMIQTSTPINPGNSGGALVNMYGQVIGITSSKIAGEEYEGIGFAIPSSTTKRVIESLIKNGYVSDRARLGVSYQVINTVKMEVEKYPSTGILIATVDNDSDLYGKINVGDLITEVGGIKITSDSVILDAIENSKPGDVLSFTVYTATGSYKTVSGKLLPDTGSS